MDSQRKASLKLAALVEEAPRQEYIMPNGIGIKRVYVPTCNYAVYAVGIGQCVDLSRATELAETVEAVEKYILNELVSKLE